MKRSILKNVLCSFVALSLGACASVNSVSLTPIPANRSKKVQATAERWIFLGFNFDNDFIDPVVDDLKEKCPRGVVTGILTKDETYAYLIVFKKQVTATGYCSEPRTARSSTSKTVGQR